MPSPFSDVVFWAAVALCAVAQVGILRPLVTPRRGPAPSAHVPVARRGTEVLWAVVPAVGLTLLLLVTWRAIHPRPATGPAPTAPALTMLLDGAAAPGAR
jgi:hypothetical protein